MNAEKSSRPNARLKEARRVSKPAHRRRASRLRSPTPRARRHAQTTKALSVALTPLKVRGDGERAFKAIVKPGVNGPRQGRATAIARDGGEGPKVAKATAIGKAGAADAKEAQTTAIVKVRVGVVKPAPTTATAKAFVAGTAVDKLRGLMVSVRAASQARREPGMVNANVKAVGLLAVDLSAVVKVAVLEDSGRPFGC
jgi:hypothetical protein